MASDNEIVVKLTALGDQFESGINDALGTWTKFLSGLGSSEVTFAGVATAATALTGALFGVVENTAKFEAGLEQLSERTGLSVEDLSKFKYAAEQSDTSLESLTTSIKFMGRTLTDAAAGNEKAQTSYRALGLNWKELLDMPVKERFLSIVQAISEVEDPSLRVGLAMRVMGRNVEEMLPFINQGREGIELLMKICEELGLVVTDKAGKAAHEFEKEMNTLGATIKRISMDIGETSMPAIKLLSGALLATATVITSGVALAWDSLRIIFDGLVGGALMFVRLLAEISDALHITSTAVKTVGEMQKNWGEVAHDAQIKLGNDMVDTGARMESIKKLILGISDAQKKAADDGTKMTDAQRLAILNEKAAAEAAAAAYKQLLDDNKKFNKSYIEDLNAILEHKRAIGVYDDEYYQALALHLALSGQKEKAVSDMVYAEKTKNGANYLNEELRRKKQIKEYDDAYFIEFRQKLIDEGASEVEIDRRVTEEKKRIKDDEMKYHRDQNQLLTVEYQGLGEAIKALWSGTEVSLESVWKTALNNFVDIMVEMALAAQEAATEIEVAMSEATFGISLVIGLIGYMFGSSGSHASSQIYQVTEAFLSSIKITLREFEGQVLDTLKRTMFLSQNVEAEWVAIRNVAGVNMSWDDYLGHVKALQDAVVARYNLEKSLINDVMDLLKSQKSFVKDINQTITDVTRSGYTKEQMFAAQKGDIQALVSAMSGSSGQDKIDIAGELKQAYLSYFETAKGLFSGNDLAKIQQEVVSGLTDVREAGKGAYDQLIDVNLQMLGVQRTGNDLQQQMVDLLKSKDDLMIEFYSAISLAGGKGIPWEQLYQTLSKLFPSVTFDPSSGVDPPLHMATGAYVTQATKALVGEGNEPEWVLPESKLQRFMQLTAQATGGAMGIGGVPMTIHQSFSFPNIKDFKDITKQQAIQMLKTTFRQAAEDLGRNGYTWGMPSRV